MIYQHTFQIQTKGRGMINITPEVSAVLSETTIDKGMCHVFLHHTSASLILCENADPEVQRDLESFFARFISDGDPLFKHTAEGVDDMPAHVRTVLTQSTLSIPVMDSTLGLGTWQGIYLWEHRLRGLLRNITVTVQG